VNFTNLKFIIVPATEASEEAAIKYGAFLQSVVDFLIIALSIFLMIKLLSVLKEKGTRNDRSPRAVKRGIASCRN
jgi:large conductance mechanosensitive channel